MNYTKEQVEGFNQLVLDTLQRGTIRNEDKKKLEAFLKYITGNDWTNKCVGCQMPQILNILKAYRTRIENEKNPQINSTTTTTTTFVDNNTADLSNNNSSVQPEQTEQNAKRKGRPAKNT